MTRDITQAEMAAYIAGIVDGEGCVGSYSWVGKKGRIIRSRVITTGMCDKECIDAMARCCDGLGIAYHRWRRKRATRDMWGLTVSNYKGVTAFAKLIPLQHAQKAQKLEALVKAFMPQVCIRCGCGHDERTPGCISCIERHHYRRKREAIGRTKLKGIKGRTGRPPKWIKKELMYATRTDKTGAAQLNIWDVYAAGGQP